MSKSKANQARKQILDDHRRIGELLSRIAAAASAAESRECLHELIPLLQRHFREEEQEIGGLHTIVQQRTPHHWNALRGLREEHLQLLAQARDLLAQAERDAEPKHLCELGVELKERIAVHEAKETEIFVDSIWTDLGEGD